MLSIQTHLVVSAVAEFYGVDVENLLGPSRKWHISNARQVAMYLLYTESYAHSLATVGRTFQRRHATVIYSLRRIESLMKRYPRLGRDITAIKQHIHDQYDC
jgi:chromosomal replication initiator protein